MAKNDELAKSLKGMTTHSVGDLRASDPIQADNTTVAEPEVEELQKQQTPPKGRPRKYHGETKAINFIVSKEMKDQIDIAVRGSTKRDMVEYITSLIQKDLDANLEKYKSRIEEDS